MEKENTLTKQRVAKLIQRYEDFLDTENEEARKHANVIHYILNTIASNINSNNWNLGFEKPKTIILVGKTIIGQKFSEEKIIQSEIIDFPNTPKEFVEILETFLQRGILPEKKQHYTEDPNYDDHIKQNSAQSSSNSSSYQGEKSEIDLKSKTIREIATIIIRDGIDNSEFRSALKSAVDSGILRREEIINNPIIIKRAIDEILFHRIDNPKFRSALKSAVDSEMFKREEIVNMPIIKNKAKSEILNSTDYGIDTPDFTSVVKAVVDNGIFTREEIMALSEVRERARNKILANLSYGINYVPFINTVKAVVDNGIFTREEIMAWPEMIEKMG